MTNYETALKSQLGYNPAQNYAAAAAGGKRKVCSQRKQVHFDGSMPKK